MVEQTQKRLKFRIQGENVHPGTVPLRDLLTAVSLYEKAVTTAGSEWGIASPTDAFYLVGVEDQSASLSLECSSGLARVVSRLHESLNAQDFRSIPGSCYSHLYKLSKLIARKGWGLVVENWENLAPDTLEFPSDLALEEPRETYFKDDTTMYVTVRSADADKKQAKLLIQGTIIKANLHSESLAVELGKLIDRTIEVNGTVKWSAQTREIKEFTALSVGQYQQTDAATAFHELAEASGGRWNGIDPDSYVKSIRGE